MGAKKGLGFVNFLWLFRSYITAYVHLFVGKAQAQGTATDSILRAVSNLSEDTLKARRAR
jgi:hypothetical protein